MDDNPYQAIVTEGEPRSTLGITIRRIIAVVLWVLAWIVAMDSILQFVLIPGEFEHITTLPGMYAVGYAAAHIVRPLGIVLLGVAAWRRSLIFALLGIVSFVPEGYYWLRCLIG